ncbi:MAG: hypothetical protein FWD26_09910 [Treponema sp.]|nr:hypothetical protein [Treponema sp.]
MKQAAFLSLMFFLIFPLWPQERPLNTGLSNDEQYAFIGLMVSDVIERYGPPRTVAAARGIELWQDDVIFQYTGVDFYIFRDRVWQVRFSATHGISNGDSKTAVLLALGNRMGGSPQDRDDHLLLPVSGKNWPLMLRVNFNSSGQTSAIFLYRLDY